MGKDVKIEPLQYTATFLRIGNKVFDINQVCYARICEDGFLLLRGNHGPICFVETEYVNNVLKELKCKNILPEKNVNVIPCDAKQKQNSEPTKRTPATLWDRLFGKCYI